MEAKLLIPLLGVVLGWLLGQVSTLLGVSRENRRFVLASLPSLMALYFEKYRINEIIKFYNLKVGSDFEIIHGAVERGQLEKASLKDLLEKYMETFEQTRRINVTLPDKTLEAVVSAVKDGIKDLSKVDPASAYKASRILNEFLLFIEIQLPDKNVDHKAYMENWGKILSVFRRDLDALKQLIFWLSLKSGLVQAVRIHRVVKSETSQLHNSAEDIYGFLSMFKPNQSLNQTQKD